jgi:hypothetical protein
MIGAKVIRETDTDIHACAHTQMHTNAHEKTQTTYCELIFFLNKENSLKY